MFRILQLDAARIYVFKRILFCFPPLMDMHNSVVIVRDGGERVQSREGR